MFKSHLPVFLYLKCKGHDIIFVYVYSDQSTQTGSGYSPLVVKNDKASSYFDKAIEAEKESSENDDIDVTDLTIAQLNLTADNTVSEDLTPSVVTTSTTTTPVHDHTAALLDEHMSSEGHVTSSNDGDSLAEPRPHPASHLTTTPTQYISTSLPSPSSDEWIAVQKRKKKSKDEGSAGKV